MNQKQAVFRKVAIDRLTSPDELTEVVRFTRPLDWLMLSVIALVVIAGLVWGIIGKLYVTETGMGLVTGPNSDGRGAVTLFVRDIGSERVTSGQAVRLKSWARQWVGSLAGSVIHVQRTKMSDLEIRRSVSDESLARICIERNLRVAVEIAVDARVRQLPSTGTLMEGEIVIRQQRPLESVLPWLSAFRGDAP